jgi:diadenosine tetraphosphate (Ap4A) HIT family hydrolase
MASKIAGDIVFNNSIIPQSQIFLLRKNVFGLINHKPFVPGHVLICARKAVAKL